MSRKVSIAPAPETTVINIHTLNEALRPGTEGDDSRATTPRIVPQETQFLAEFDNLTFTHNFREECCTCPACRTVLDIKTRDETLVMQSLQKMGCWIGTHENIEVFNSSTNELVILIEFIRDGCFSLSNTVQVYGPPGYLVGIIQRATSWCSSSFEIQNANAETMYTVQPLMRWFGPNEFPIITKHGSQKVAEVVIRGSCSLNLSYIEILPPAVKALLIGFTFYLDMIEQAKRAARAS